MAYALIDGSDRFFFIKMLFKWAGSIWQLLWIDLVVYILLYFLITLIYRLAFVPNADLKANFEGFIKYVDGIGHNVPLSFILGFFVTMVVGRWWQVCMTIPWLNTPAFLAQSFMTGGSAVRARMFRVNVLRYFNMAWLLQMKNLSEHAAHRFQLRHNPETGRKLKVAERTIRFQAERLNADPMVKKFYGTLVTEEDVERLEAIGAESAENEHYDPEYWVPLQWATQLMRKARDEDIITDDRQYVEFVRNTNKFRDSLGTLWLCTHFNVPLVYIQVVIIAVYSFFLSELLATQFVVTPPAASDVITTLAPTTNNATCVEAVATQTDYYIPLFTLLSFIFYVGWFKIGISLMNPLGDDAQDIPLSEILNYNLMVSLRSGGIIRSRHFYPSKLIDVTTECAAASSSADGGAPEVVEGPHGMEKIALAENLNAAPPPPPTSQT